MSEFKIFRLLFAIDFNDSDNPGERTVLALVGVKVGSEIGLGLVLWGATLFMWVSRMGEKKKNAQV